MTRVLFACGTDNDGYPTCMGDTSTCAPDGQCKGWPAVPVRDAACEPRAEAT